MSCVSVRVLRSIAQTLRAPRGPRRTSARRSDGERRPSCRNAGCAIADPAQPADLGHNAVGDGLPRVAHLGRGCDGRLLDVVERGLLIAAKPKKLVIHPSNTFVATRVLSTELSTTAGGSNAFAKNDVNALKTNGAVPGGWTVNNWLTDPDAWFLLTDVPNGLKHFVRVPLKQDMEGDFETGNVRYKARERYSFGVSDPLGIYGCPGA